MYIYIYISQYISLSLSLSLSIYLYIYLYIYIYIYIERQQHGGTSLHSLASGGPRLRPHAPSEVMIIIVIISNT